MNSLIAKVGNEYKRVVARKINIIENLTLGSIEEVDFTPSHKLDDEEWFKLSNFSQKDFFDAVCRDNYSTVSLNQISNNEYSQISNLAIFQDGQKHFQRITPSRYINQKTFLDFSGEPQIVKQCKQLEIKPDSDAVYDVNNDILYFKDIAKIKLIFPGIEVLHREATQEEVDAFLENDFIVLDNYEANAVGALNRKRIADIGLKYHKLSGKKKSKLIEYAKAKAGIDISDQGAFIISSETNLKHLLYAMDQRYYYADIYEENRVANSVRVVE